MGNKYDDGKEAIEDILAYTDGYHILGDMEKWHS